MTSDSDFARQDDPLGAIGASLTAAARRRSARLRRRRRGLLAATAAAATLAVTGGAFAVTGASTGVPVLDRWIGNATAPRPHDGFDELRPAVTPVPGGGPRAGFSPVVEIPAPGGETIVAAGYASRRDMICSVMLDRADGAEQPRGGIGCLGARLLRRALRRTPARLAGGGGSPIVDADPPLALYSGVARSDVVAVKVGLPGRPLVDGVVSGAWQPPGWKGERLRIFFAAMAAPKGRPGPKAFRRWFPDRIEARLADGTVVDSSL